MIAADSLSASTASKTPLYYAFTKLKKVTSEHLFSYLWCHYNDIQQPIPKQLIRIAVLQWG